MDDQLKNGSAKAADQRHSIDPLRRVFVPREFVDIEGVTKFKTSDRTAYYRDAGGAIRRMHPKMRGKAARRADRLARRG